MQILGLEIVNLSTEALENFIDSRYEAGAPQDELDYLEIEYSKRVSEDDLNMTEEDPQMSEAFEMGVDLEEWLAKEYNEFINPEWRIGGREAKDYFHPESFNEFLTLNPKTGITREQMMEAARDIYEYRVNLIRRYRSSNKISNIPKELLPKNR